MSSESARSIPAPSSNLPAYVIPPSDPEGMIRLLQEWMADESGYDEETWPELKAALDRNRPPGSRKLFDE